MMQNPMMMAPAQQQQQVWKHMNACLDACGHDVLFEVLWPRI